MKRILSFEPARIVPWLLLSSFISRPSLLEKKSAVITDQIVFVSEAMQRLFRI